jgi:predicted SAM-dependent methyltransferase
MGLKLHVGCGDIIKEGYLNLDLRQTHPSVIVADIRTLPYRDVDEIFACDVLEHVSHFETASVIQHWYDILRPGGKLFIQSPCLELVCKFALEATTIEQKEMALARIFAGKGYMENEHKNALDPLLLDHYFKQAGFDISKAKYEIGNFGNKTNLRVTIYK